MEPKCDRCGALALWVVLIKDGQLHFCGHHKNEHNAAFIKLGIRVLPVITSKET